MKTPLEPFVRATYRWNRAFSDNWLWRVEPRVFVQSQRGAGISVQNVVDHVLDDTWLLRSYSVVVAEEEVEGVSWTSKLVAYQNLSKKHALSYAVYGTGETDYEVPLRHRIRDAVWRLAGAAATEAGQAITNARMPPTERTRISWMH